MSTSHFGDCVAIPTLEEETVGFPAYRQTGKALSTAGVYRRIGVWYK